MIDAETWLLSSSRSRDSAKQLTRRDSEAQGDLADGRHAEISKSALGAAELDHVYARAVRRLLLRDPELEAPGPDVLADSLPRLHGARCSVTQPKASRADNVQPRLRGRIDEKGE